MSRLSTVYPGWWLAIGASLSLAVVNGTTFWAFGLLAGPLEAEFGWPRSLVAAVASLTLLVSGAASPLVGRLVDRWQPRRVIMIGSAGTAAAFALLSQVTDLWQFMLLMAVLAFFRAWIDYVPFTTLVTAWFSRRRATAMGIATSGFGLGGLLVMPAAAEMLSGLGWRAFFVAAAGLVVLVNGTFVLFARDAPSGRWAGREDGAVTTSAHPAGDGLLPAAEARRPLKTLVFWLMAAGFALFFFAQWAFLFHGPQVLEHGGLDPRQTALVFAAAAGLGVAVRLASGAVLDRIRRLEVLAACVLAAMAAAVLLLIAGVSAPLLFAFVLLWGVGSGVGPALEPLLVGRVFGRARYAGVYGAMDGVDTVVAIPGPWIGGLLFDLTGTYTPLLVLYGLSFVAGAGSFAWLARTVSRFGGHASIAAAVPVRVPASSTHAALPTGRPAGPAGARPAVGRAFGLVLACSSATLLLWVVLKPTDRGHPTR